MFSRYLYLTLLLTLFISASNRIEAQSFTNVANSAGVDVGAGVITVAWADYDNDGHLDLFLTTTGFSNPNILYRNNGNNTFTNVAATAGVNDTGNGVSAAWADYDNDGDLDLYAGRQTSATNLLYRNEGNGTFTEIGASAGVNDNHQAAGISWGDFNSDGFVDLFVSNEQSGGSGSTDRLYRNEGNGSFTDIAGSAGVQSVGNSASVAWGDYDDDGDLDAVIGQHTFGNPILYRNNGNSTFTNVSSGSGLVGQGLSTFWGDYDNDGDLDLYMPNFAGNNLLYRNEGGGSFTELGNSAGVDDGNQGRTAGWADYDHDGDLDLFSSNQGQADVLYQNNGSGSFTNVAATEGVNSSTLNYGAGWGDYDNDGDLDLFVCADPSLNLLYRNNGNSNRWLHITTVGTASNKAGIGTKVTAVTGSSRQRRDVSGNAGNLVQHSLPVEFGFGSTTTIDSLILEWPSGTIQTLTNQSTNQSLTLVEPGGAITFTEIAATAGVNDNSNGDGIAWGDYDGDNDLDIYIANNSGAPNRLYRNNGNSTFTDEAITANVADTGDGTGAAWGDYDNDGDLDLIHANANGGTDRFYRNEGNGTFSEIGATVGFNDTGHGISVAWGDYNNDGRIDIYLTQTSANRLYRNESNGTFTDAASSAGVNYGPAAFSAFWGDYDNDGDLDLFLNNNNTANRLYRNEGNSTFVDRASAAGVNVSGDGSSTSWGDYDNDGDLDLYLSYASVSANRLYRNEGNGTFIDRAPAAGVNPGGTRQATAWADYDNDGDLDLYVAQTSTNDKLYRNDGNDTFTDEATATGIANPTTGQIGASWADYDSDGDLDLYVTVSSASGGPNLLFRNNGNGNRWLQIKTVGTISNQSGIGATITTVIGSNRQRRDVSGGSGFYSQPSLPVEFGFGGTTNIDSLIVNWPSGIEQTFTNQNTNQLLTIVETATVSVLIPDTVATYSDTTLVPIRITSDVTGLGIVAAEICIAYDNTVVTPGAPDNTELTGSLVATGWSVEDNIFTGTGNIDTLSIAMSTAQDTLSGLGDLVYLALKTTSSRQPDSTPLEITKILFNDGDPSVSKQDGSLTLIGSDGAIVATPDSINPGDTVTITVTDADFDLDVGSPDQVSATAISKLYNDSQTVILTETGNNTGIFTNTVSTIFSLSAGPSNDGVITTIAGDSICVSYVDSLTSVGTTLTRQDTVEVIGGADGVVQASYVVQALNGRNGVRDTVRVQITDADLDTDVGVAEQVSATITNAISGEVETVTLTETAVSSGIFQVRVPSIAGASGTNNNGELSLTSWDTLNVSYTDALTAQGGSTALLDTTRVVNLFGDVRVNDQVQAFDAARLLAISVGLISSNTQTTLVGDVDGGGTIQAFDASLVLQYVVRLIDRFPVQLDFTDDPKNHPFEKPVPLDQIIALGELQPHSDDTYLLPIHLGEREGILSGTLTLGLDPGIEILDVTPAMGYGSFMTAHNATAQDVRIAFAGSQSDLSGSGDVIILHLRSKSDAPIRFSLDQVALNGQLLTPSVNIEAIEAIESQAQALVTDLYHNVPNPFNPQTTIGYDLSQAGQVNLVIYSITGQRIRTLVSEHQAVGSYQIVWDGKDAFGRNVGSGVYLMRMSTGTFTKTQKMLLLR